jgi:hypothetical protein
MLQELETDTLRVTIHKIRERFPATIHDVTWYYINAWGRGEKRAAWRQVWHNRIFIRYRSALDEFNDRERALRDYKNMLEVT